MKTITLPPDLVYMQVFNDYPKTNEPPPPADPDGTDDTEEIPDPAEDDEEEVPPMPDSDDIDAPHLHELDDYRHAA